MGQSRWCTRDASTAAQEGGPLLVQHGAQVVINGMRPRRPRVGEGGGSMRQMVMARAPPSSGRSGVRSRGGACSTRQAAGARRRPVRPVLRGRRTPMRGKACARRSEGTKGRSRARSRAGTNRRRCRAGVGMVRARRRRRLRKGTFAPRRSFAVDGGEARHGVSPRCLERPREGSRRARSQGGSHGCEHARATDPRPDGETETPISASSGCSPHAAAARKREQKTCER